MHPITACGIETLGAFRIVEPIQSVACTLLPLAVLKQSIVSEDFTKEGCMHPIARALREREPKAKRELSATHAWTLGKREPKAKRAPSEQVYRLRY